MAEVTEQQMNDLRDLQVAFHAGHEGEHGPLTNCTHESCREARMGMSYLNSKVSSASGARQIDLK